jgi:hypothetical protein
MLRAASRELLIIVHVTLGSAAGTDRERDSSEITPCWSLSSFCLAGAFKPLSAKSAHRFYYRCVRALCRCSVGPPRRSTSCMEEEKKTTAGWWQPGAPRRGVWPLEAQVRWGGRRRGGEKAPWSWRLTAELVSGAGDETTRAMAGWS